MECISALTVKLFADGADLATIAALSELPYIRGFTTNPSLMRRRRQETTARFAPRRSEAGRRSADLREILSG